MKNKNFFDKYIDNNLTHQEGMCILCIVILVVFSCKGFYHVDWPYWGNIIFNILCVVITVICFLKYTYFRVGYFSKVVLFFIVIPYLSITNSYSIHGQSILSSIISVFGHTFFWMLYFMLHIYKVRESSILRVLLYLSVFIVAVQIIQQFTYPNAPFGTYNEEQMIERGSTEYASKRNGIWRFRMHVNSYYTAPVIFALLVWIKEKFSFKYMIMFVLLLASVYLTLTRQIIFSVFFSILTYFFIDKKRNVIIVIFGFLLLCILYMNYDTLFGSFGEKTMEEANVDNIRVFSAMYFWNESVKSVLTFLLGHGIPSGGSPFEDYLYMLGHSWGFYVSDVGFIGMLWQYGFIYVLLSYYVLYCLFFKLKKYIPLYIRLFALFAAIMSIMIFPFGIKREMTLVWPILLYVCDLHLYQSPLALQK